jgi:hypothetical protein
MQGASHRAILIAMALVAILGALALPLLWPSSSETPRVEVFHLLKTYPARSGALTINVTGQITPIESAKTVRYRLNDGQWQIVPQEGPRTPPPTFTIEIPPESLKSGENCLYFNVQQVQTPQNDNLACFHYQASALRPEQTDEIDWNTQPLDVQDGRWQVINRSNGSMVRPVPGFEGYDRILNITGAFSGGRRVEATMVFEAATQLGKPFGFGVLPLWGGHPDETGYFPRRGWAYGLAWYYSLQNGVGAEIASKYAQEPFQSTYTYRSYAITPGSRYRLITEALPMHTSSGEYQGYAVRMKWWRGGETEPKSWMSINEYAAQYLPEQNYAVALLAHRSQVEFSSVRVIALDETLAAPFDSTVNVEPTAQFNSIAKLEPASAKK